MEASCRLNDRIGKFFVSLNVVRDNPEDVALILNGVVVVMAQAMIAYDAIEYHGFNPDFAPCPMGRDIPEYKCLITVKEDGTKTAKWEGCDKDVFTDSQLSGYFPLPNPSGLGSPAHLDEGDVDDTYTVDAEGFSQ